MPELQGEMQRLSGTTLDVQGAANVYAGVPEGQRTLDLVGALNYRAGTTGLDLLGVLNRLAGTSGLDAGSAAAAIPRYVGLRLSGAAGNYVSSPDSVLNSVTGDIDIRVCAKLDDWTPAAGVFASLVAKRTGAGQVSYYFRVDPGGGLTLGISADGTNHLTASSSALPSVTDGAVLWVRATLDIDNGSGQRVTTFYTSPDGVTWTMLGVAQSATGIVSIFDGTSPLELGSISAGTAQLLAGTIYYAEIRAGIDGEVVSRFDASKVLTSGTQTPATINGWTLNGTALYRRDDYMRLPGTAGNYLSFPDTAANSVTGDIDIRAKVSLDDWTPATTIRLVTKDSGSGVGRSFNFAVTSTGLTFQAFDAAGAALINLGSTIGVPFTDGQAGWVRAIRNATTGSATFYTSSDGMTWSQLGDVRSGAAGSIADTNQVLELGAHVAFGNWMTGNVYAAEVRSGIGGTVVASFDARDITTPWTVNGTGWSWEGASFSGKPVTALMLPGTAGNYASTPDSAGNSVTGDIDIRAKVSLDDWTPASLTNLVGKIDSGTTRSYWFEVTTGGILQLNWSADGSTPITTSSTVATGFADGATKWVRTTLDVDNGAAGRDVKFYTSDDGVSWLQLGSTVTVAGTTSIFDSTSVVTVGARYPGSSVLLAGKVYEAQVRAGIDGPIVARFDPVAIERTGLRTPTTTVQPGGTPNMLTPNQASIETDATGWSALTNATIARSTAQFLDGAASLSITATAIGISETLTNPQNIPIVAGKSYTARASLRAATAGRVTRVAIHWYTSAGGFISNVLGNGTDVTTGWTEVTVTGVAPATAALAAIVIRISDAAQLATEVHYVDRVSLVESAALWSINGSAWDLVQVTA